MNSPLRTALAATAAAMISALSAFVAAAAPVGTGFSYQGQLGNGGQPANGRYDLRFNLYTVGSGGSPVGVGVTNENVSVSNGLFTTTVDFGANVFTGDEYWLDLGVRSGSSTGAFTPLTPRQLLTPVPYALHANEASSLPDGAITGAALRDGSVVRSINGLQDDFRIVGGDGVMVATAGNSIVIAAAPPDCNTYSNCYWNLLGNGNITPGINFLGTTAGELAPLEFRVNNNRSLLHTFTAATTSPNIVGGYKGNIVSGTGGTIGGGGQQSGINRVQANWGTVGGGYSNVIQSVSTSGTIGGGATNQIAGLYGAIGGGALNVASNSSFVGGGIWNRAISEDAVIGGGQANLVASYDNLGFTVLSIFSTVGGGSSNVISGGEAGTIAGGQENRLIGTGGRQVHFGTIAGGQGNAVLSDSFSSHYSTVGGGLSNVVRTAGRATIGGGEGNKMFLEGHYATIGGGLGNSVDGRSSTISGGQSNVVAGPGNPDYASIGGGRDNSILADSHHTTIAGGRRNRIAGFASDSSVGGGATNFIESATFATISGGTSNSVSGNFGTVPGGRQNRASGSDTFAAGRRAVAQHNGSFVWADDTDADFASTSSKQFAVRADNGVMIQANNRALDLRGGGAVRVAGAGIGTGTPAFIHRATAGNINAHTTTINHPHCNGDPNAILIVTPNWNPGGVGGIYNNHAVGVYYNGAAWAIFNQDFAVMPVDAAFNVLVIKP